jgi:hypothetical protein
MSTLRWHDTKDLLPECDRRVVAVPARGLPKILCLSGLNKWDGNGRIFTPDRWAYVIELGPEAP